jgi:3-hydroxyisobutyrate dehydrogenase-like beta-hydroxyacid dehydrogenase
MAQTRIGFIGLGAMGGGMSLSLLDKGFSLTVRDTDEAALAPLRARGAVIAQSALEVADQAEIVIMCLPSPKVSLEVAFGDHGIVHGKAVKHVVECSTIGFDVAQKLNDGLREKKVGFVDAPVSGGSDGARAGVLSTIVAGPKSEFDAVEIAIKAFANEVFYIGDKPGQAQTAKLINNYFSSAAKIMTFEGMAMGLKVGLDLDKLVEFINVSTGRNMATLEKFPDRMLRIFRSKGPTSIGIKDLQLYLDEATRAGAPVTLAQSVQELQTEHGEYGFHARKKPEMTDYIEKFRLLDEARRKREGATD